MKNTFLVLVLLVVLVGGGYFFMNKPKPADNTAAGSMEQAVPVPSDGSTGSSGNVEEMMVVSGASGPAATGKESVKEFTVDGFEFGFDVKILTVKKGDKVKITLTNSGKMSHDWVVDELSARTERITNGQTDTITFVADKPGTFEFYCSVGQHRANGMKGSLIVQ